MKARATHRWVGEREPRKLIPGVEIFLTREEADDLVSIIEKRTQRKSEGNLTLLCLSAAIAKAR